MPQNTEHAEEAMKFGQLFAAVKDVAKVYL